MSGQVVAFPDPVLARWRRRFPEEAERDPDPQVNFGEGGPCRDCGQTFAWRGYEGLCGWCHDDEGGEPAA